MVEKRQTDAQGKDRRNCSSAEETKRYDTGESYKESLEREILRRIHIIQSPDYTPVPRFPLPDIVFVWILAGIMLALILWGATF